METTQNFIRTRSYKNFDKTQYRDNIMNHYLYVETLYEQHPDKITENIQTIMQDSINDMAPVKIIKITNKNQTKLSQETREKMAMRDMARQEFKNSNNPEDLRHYKNLKN